MTELSALQVNLLQLMREILKYLKETFYSDETAIYHSVNSYVNASFVYTDIHSIQNHKRVLKLCETDTFEIHYHDQTHM